MLTYSVNRTAPYFQRCGGLNNSREELLHDEADEVSNPQFYKKDDRANCDLECGASKCDRLLKIPRHPTDNQRLADNHPRTSRQRQKKI
jgi:hypothetical protein